jgi:hypothetical protein
MAGFYEGTDLANKTFYGFKLIQATGDLNVDIIQNGDGVVSLPEPTYIVGPNQYVNWIFSTSTYQFRWGPKGHLEMVFV